MSLAPRTPHTFGAEAATSTIMNDEVKALWDGLLDGWDTASTSPGWLGGVTDPTIGNGSRNSQVYRIGQTIHWRIAFQMGSTTTFGTGFYSFELPFELTWHEHDPIGVCSLYDASTSDVYGLTAVYAGTTGGTPYVRAYGSDATKLGAVTPITLASGDRLVLTGYGELP